MPYLWLPFFFVLLIFTTFVGYAVLVTWRRVRSLEARLDEVEQRAAQGDLLLSEYVAEIERVADRVLERVQAAEAGEVEPSLIHRRQGLLKAPEASSSSETYEEMSSIEGQSLKVQRLAAEGHTPAHIAEALHMGVGEVELILGLGRLMSRDEQSDA